ncbi:substrate-binding domain-containing protein [Marinomonas atlantica]|uniref:substrate-binding domain-containing protein n=1 Tax=Marinomonas atlantica TaxID=1806668 RepID=UPI000AC5B927|nr:substrate-binding domain-containing protein [Marinomonas atlantica]MCO4787220.1 substrate-binding domain-containing protein [Marinomonas atlantica]
MAQRFIMQLNGWCSSAVRKVWLAGLLALCVASHSALASNELDQPLRSIGISVADLGNPYFVELVDSVTRRANELVEGQSVDVIVRSDAYDLKRQVRQLNEFIDRKVDLIILTAADEYKIAPVVARAQLAGIKVIAVDVNAHGADATITTDNVQAGVIACERLAQEIGYQGQFVIINGVLVSSVLERVAGCKSAINRYPHISLLSDRLNGTGSQEGGMEAMTYLMEEYDHLDAVFAINDPTASGALMAAQHANRNEFVLASVDGSQFAIDTIQQPNLWIATAVQRPKLMAERAVEIGLALLKGEEVRQRFILIPAQLVQKSAHE